MLKWDDDIYNIPAYPVTDAARYLRIPLATLRTWLKGRSYLTKDGQQAFEPLAQGNQAPFIAKVSKDRRVEPWKNRTQLLKMLA
jgi:hypothetical protein